MGGRYEDHPEVFHEYQATTGKGYYGPERAPASTWKSELENTNKKFENKLGQVHEKLDNMMDQFRKLLTRPMARSPSPGGRPATGERFHCGERGHFKWDCPKFRKGPNQKPIPYRGSGQEKVYVITATSPDISEMSAQIEECGLKRELSLC
ncbi:unnamed protein product [Mytilus coruscus]|uniref:CCHC-type domain-containing protein n=1 Tax=Mytilus coruscus TaxID=42192 RepID=A0A6J8E5L2_MYTCO|nr:unnamed protein product [Mytilus coruscus]